MFQIIRATSLPLLKKKEIYFDRNPVFRKIFFSTYMFSPVKKNLFFFKKYPCLTMVIDLMKHNAESLLQSFRYSHRARIKRAESAGMKFEVENSIDAFLELYKPFASIKDLMPLKRQTLWEARENLIIFKVTLDDQVLGMASVLFDDEEGRARGYWMANTILDEPDKNKRKLISESTLFMYYNCMVYYINKGYKIFDLGGYWQDDHDRYKGLNEFKDGFRGEVIWEYTYRSYFEVVFLYLKELLRSKETSEIKNEPHSYNTQMNAQIR